MYNSDTDAQARSATYITHAQTDTRHVQHTRTCTTHGAGTHSHYTGTHTQAGTHKLALDVHAWPYRHNTH